jgi:hypothetical protein
MVMSTTRERGGRPVSVGVGVARLVYRPGEPARALRRGESLAAAVRRLRPAELVLPPARDWAGSTAAAALLAGLLAAADTEPPLLVLIGSTGFDVSDALDRALLRLLVRALADGPHEQAGTSASTASPGSTSPR